MWIPLMAVSAYLCNSIAYREFRRKNAKPGRVFGFVRVCAVLFGYTALACRLENGLDESEWLVFAAFEAIGYLAAMYVAFPVYWYRLLNRRFAHSFLYGIRGKHRMQWKPRRRRAETI